MDIVDILNSIHKLDNNDKSTLVFEDLTRCKNFINNLNTDLKLIHLNIRVSVKNFQNFALYYKGFPVFSMS